MTANAMASDREACLAAGMNDHVGKPFDLNHLVKVLRRCAGRGEAAPDAAAGGAADLNAAASAAAVNAGVDIKAALNRLGGHLGAYQRMLRGFVDDLAAMPAQLQSLLHSEDSAAAARLLHTLKGVAATLGAMQLAAVAGQGEKLMAGGPAAAQAAAVTQQSIEAIVQATPKLRTLLDALLAASAPAADSAHVPIDQAALLAALRAMAGHLQNADMAATDAMAELQRRYGAALGERLRHLDDAVSGLDFERAATLCDELIMALPA